MAVSTFSSEKLPRPRADDPSPGQDAWMRFLEVPGPWDKPLTSPHTLSWTQEAAPVEGKGVHGLRPMKGPQCTLDRNPGRQACPRRQSSLQKSPPSRARALDMPSSKLGASLLNWPEAESAAYERRYQVSPNSPTRCKLLVLRAEPPRSLTGKHFEHL